MPIATRKSFTQWPISNFNGIVISSQLGLRALALVQYEFSNRYTRCHRYIFKRKLLQ